MSEHKAIIFDLDGVLVESKHLHYRALNMALSDIAEKYTIQPSEQSSTYEGLTTFAKLDILSSLKGLPRDSHQKIWNLKQEYFQSMLGDIEKNQALVDIFKYIKSKGIKIGVASNAIKSTLVSCLSSLGVADYVDTQLSNEDVEQPKPSPEIYKKAMSLLGSDIDSTVIFEDSKVGRTAALESGAQLVCVDEDHPVSLKTVELAVDALNLNQKLINVLIPMAGMGSRFQSAGYDLPKPLIDVDGIPMIQAVVESLGVDAHYIYIVQEDHYYKYKLEVLLTRLTPNCKIVKINGLTDGAAITTLYAENFINNDIPLLIANSDQIVQWEPQRFIDQCRAALSAGAIATFTASDPKWSYVKSKKDFVVEEVAEKVVISDTASVGIYFWTHGSDYVKYVNQMIDKQIKTNGEYYICPTYNEAIIDGKLITHSPVDAMYGIGTPSDLEHYLNVKNSS